MLARRRASVHCLGGRLLAGALAATAIVWPATHASAQGLFDLLFGPRREAPRQAPPPQQPVDPSEAPFASPGRSAAFCVRLCDGRFFPLQRTEGAPEQLCGAFCPASQTKVFFGGDIDRAVARDGSRHAGLPNAFVHRRKQIPDCTCNGRDAFGLATIDPKTDPTLRPGDVAAPPGGLKR